MGEGRKKGTGGGGTPLTFKVVGGTTTPTNPKKNTIWVNTNVTITSYVFKATQPSASEGRVWIRTGNSSGVQFNALKKNWLYVYPMSVKQYVGGAWVDKTAKSYQNGKWVDWIIYTYLFKSGDGALVTFKKNTETNSTITVGKDSIVSTYSATSVISSNLRASYDVTGKKYLCVDYVCTATGKTTYFGLTESETSSTTFPSSYICRQAMVVGEGRKTVQIPITGANGIAWFVVIGAAKYVIYNIWFEE